MLEQETVSMLEVVFFGTPQPGESTICTGEAIGFVRVSTSEQAVEGVSLAVQEERIRMYCHGAGLTLVDIARDEGVSGFSKALSDRPGGKTVLQALSTGTSRHVVGLKLDRLFRDAADALVQTREWDREGIALHLLDMGGQAIDTSSAVGRFFLSVMAGFAELERNLISERTASSMAHKKAQRRVYGCTPFGFDRVGDELAENASELAIVAKIRAWRAEGLSLGKTAKRLNSEGVPTKTGKKWYGSTVNYILKNTSLYRESA